MAANAGRALLIDIDDGAGGTEVEIAGQTTGNITVNREAIDITTKSDSGVRTLLAQIGTFSLDVGFEGVLENATFLTALLDDAPTALFDATVTIGNIGTVTGTFFLGPGEITGEDGANAIGYSGQLMSSGTVTFT